MLMYDKNQNKQHSFNLINSAHFNSVHASVILFGWPFVKRFALCYRTVVCPILSVTLVYYGQTVGWIKMKLGTQVGLSPGHIVLDRDPPPPPQRGTAPNFRPRFGRLLRPPAWKRSGTTLVEKTEGMDKRKQVKRVRKGEREKVKKEQKTRKWMDKVTRGKRSAPGPCGATRWVRYSTGTRYEQHVLKNRSTANSGFGNTDRL